MAVEVRCGVCGSTIKLGNDTVPVSTLKDGIAYLVPETVRNENTKQSKTEARLELLKAAGVNVDKMKELMGSSDGFTSVFKDIFEDDDPILKEIGSSGFIKNPELFRRWISAQTWRFIKDPSGWTAAVRKQHDLNYVFRQTRSELWLLLKLSRKGLHNDRRFWFFTLEDMKAIFIDLAKFNKYFYDLNKPHEAIERFKNANSYESLLGIMNHYRWGFSKKDSFRPRNWLNCYKGAGAYYTLQNLIRTHGLVLPNCKDMNESLEKVESLTKDILSYKGIGRRWDILLSVLTRAVVETHFELKY